MLASSLPDPGTFEVPAATVMLFGFLATACALVCEMPRDEVEWLAFIGGFVGAGFGLFVWAFGLLTGLY